MALSGSQWHSIALSAAYLRRRKRTPVGERERDLARCELAVEHRISFDRGHGRRWNERRRREREDRFKINWRLTLCKEQMMLECRRPTDARRAEAVGWLGMEQPQDELARARGLLGQRVGLGVVERLDALKREVLRLAPKRRRADEHLVEYAA